MPLQAKIDLDISGINASLSALENRLRAISGSGKAMQRAMTEAFNWDAQQAARTIQSRERDIKRVVEAARTPEDLDMMDRRGYRSIQSSVKTSYDRVEGYNRRLEEADKKRLDAIARAEAAFAKKQQDRYKEILASLQAKRPGVDITDDMVRRNREYKRSVASYSGSMAREIDRAETSYQKEATKLQAKVDALNSMIVENINKLAAHEKRWNEKVAQAQRYDAIAPTRDAMLENRDYDRRRRASERLINRQYGLDYASGRREMGEMYSGAYFRNRDMDTSARMLNANILRSYRGGYAMSPEQQEFLAGVMNAHQSGGAMSPAQQRMAASLGLGRNQYDIVDSRLVRQVKAKEEDPAASARRARADELRGYREEVAAILSRIRAGERLDDQQLKHVRATKEAIAGGRELNDVQRMLASRLKMGSSEIEIMNNGLVKQKTHAEGLRQTLSHLRNAYLVYSWGYTQFAAPLARMAVQSVRDAATFERSTMAATMVGERKGISGVQMQGAIQDLSSDGLMSVTETSRALTNLVSTGIGLPKAIELLKAFKDSAALARQGNLELGEAVVGAADGFKNMQSRMVDNAGITKNLSVVLKEQAALQGKRIEQLSELEKMQLIANGLIKEAAVYMGGAAASADTLSGTLARADAASEKLSQSFGRFMASTGVVDLLARAFGSMADSMSSIADDATKTRQEIELSKKIKLGYSPESVGETEGVVKVTRYNSAVSALNQFSTSNLPSLGNRKVRLSELSLAGGLALGGGMYGTPEAIAPGSLQDPVMSQSPASASAYAPMINSLISYVLTGKSYADIFKPYPLRGNSKSPFDFSAPAAVTTSTARTYPWQSKYDKYVLEAAELHGVSPDLIRAVIDQESSGNPRAISPVGARGLMQLMRGAQTDTGTTNVFNPRDNILGGTKYLAAMLGANDGDVAKALMGYNGGQAHVVGGDVSADARKYAADVMARLATVKVAEQPWQFPMQLKGASSIQSRFDSAQVELADIKKRLVDKYDKAMSVGEAEPMLLKEIADITKVSKLLADVVTSQNALSGFTPPEPPSDPILGKKGKGDTGSARSLIAAFNRLQTGTEPDEWVRRMEQAGNDVNALRQRYIESNDTIKADFAKARGLDNKPEVIGAAFDKLFEDAQARVQGDKAKAMKKAMEGFSADLTKSLLPDVGSALDRQIAGFKEQADRYRKMVSDLLETFGSEFKDRASQANGQIEAWLNTNTERARMEEAKRINEDRVQGRYSLAQHMVGLRGQYGPKSDYETVPQSLARMRMESSRKAVEDLIGAYGAGIGAISGDNQTEIDTRRLEARTRLTNFSSDMMSKVLQAQMQGAPDSAMAALYDSFITQLDTMLAELSKNLSDPTVYAGLAASIRAGLTKSVTTAADDAATASKEFVDSFSRKMRSNAGHEFSWSGLTRTDLTRETYEAELKKMLDKKGITQDQYDELNKQLLSNSKLAGTKESIDEISRAFGGVAAAAQLASISGGKSLTRFASTASMVAQQVQGIASGLTMFTTGPDPLSKGIGLLQAGAGIFGLIDSAIDGGKKKKKSSSASSRDYGATISRGPTHVYYYPTLNVSADGDVVFSQDGLEVVMDRMKVMVQQAVENGEISLDAVRF